MRCPNYKGTRIVAAEPHFGRSPSVQPVAHQDFPLPHFLFTSRHLARNTRVALSSSLSTVESVGNPVQPLSNIVSSPLRIAIRAELVSWQPETDEQATSAHVRKQFLVGPAQVWNTMLQHPDATQYMIDWLTKHGSGWLVVAAFCSGDTARELEVARVRYQRRNSL